MKVFPLLTAGLSLGLLLGLFGGLENLKQLKESKLRLEEQIASLVTSLKNYQTDVAEAEELFIIPSTLLNADGFKNLGLHRFINQSHHINFNFHPKLRDILVPDSSKNLFLFESKDPIQVPQHGSAYEAMAEFLGSSLPFNVPKMLNLVNYYLVLPRTFLTGKTEWHNNFPTHLFLTSTTDQLPIFLKVISGGSPLMVFAFDNDESTSNKIPIMNIKNYLSTNEQPTAVSLFFDLIAKHWVHKLDIASLMQSAFCKTSELDSFCLQIPNDSLLQLLPFTRQKGTNEPIRKVIKFQRQSGLSRKEESPREEVSSQLKKRKITSKLRREVPSEFLLKKRDIAREIDSEFLLKRGASPLFKRQVDSDQLVIGIGSNEKVLRASLGERTKRSMVCLPSQVKREALSKRHEKPQTVIQLRDTHGSPFSKRGMKDPMNSRLDGLEQDSDILNDGTVLEKRAESLLRGIAHYAGDKIRGNGYDDLDEEEENGKPSLGLLEKIARVNNRLRAWANGVDSDDDDDNDGLYSESSYINEHYEWGNLKRELETEDGMMNLPLSLVRAYEPEVQSPRNALYAQVQQALVLNNMEAPKKYSIFSTEETCEPVTWFNIFHHAIFGKAKFCPPEGKDVEGLI